jgi:probable F420-dependent oxidoreductase
MMLPYADGLVTDGGFLREFAAATQEAGIESLWAVEHVVVADGYLPHYPYASNGRMPGPRTGIPMTDPLETIAFLAGASSTLRFGTAMVIAPLHSPVVLAKRVATIDLHSGGRLLLGLGIGWQREEYAAVGAPFARRGERLEDCIGAMRALWSQAPATFEGTHLRFEDLHCLPRPERGTVPIVLGGNSEPALRRAGRIGDGWFPYTIDPAGFAAGADAVRATAAAAGRAEDAVELTAWPGSCDPDREFDADFVRGYTAAGATRLVLNQPLRGPNSLLGPRGLDGLADHLARYRDAVVSAL